MLKYFFVAKFINKKYRNLCKNVTISYMAFILTGAYYDDDKERSNNNINTDRYKQSKQITNCTIYCLSFFTVFHHVHNRELSYNEANE